MSFSGGRDSSALLAVALNVARRQGLPEPVALTLRYSENTDTEESAWQKLVVDHLRPKAWEIVEVAPDAAEFLAPPAWHPSGPMVYFGPRRCTSRPGGWVAPAAPQLSPERAATRSSALTVPAQFGPFWLLCANRKPSLCPRFADWREMLLQLAARAASARRKMADHRLPELVATTTAGPGIGRCGSADDGRGIGHGPTPSARTL